MKTKSLLIPFVSLLATVLLVQGALGADTQDRNLLSPAQWKPKETWQKKGSHWDMLSDEKHGEAIRLMKSPVVLAQDIKTDGA